MLTFQELAGLGFCPKQKYGWMKPFPPGFELPEKCPQHFFKHLPLQIQVFYQTVAEDGYHDLKFHLTSS